VTDAGDLDGDGHAEVLAATRDGTLLVLNDMLQEIGRYEAGKGSSISPRLVHLGHRQQVLLSVSSPDGALEYIMLDVRRKLVLPAGFPLGILVPSLIFLALAIGLVLWLYSRRIRTASRIFNRLGLGIILLNHRGRIRAINQQARLFLEMGEEPRLLGSIKELKIAPSAKEMHKAIQELVEQERPGTKIVRKRKDGKERRIEIQVQKVKPRGWLASLEDVTEREFGRRVSTWVPVAQQLAHGIKNPLSHIRLAIQRLEKLILEKKDKKQEASRYSAIVAGEVERLLKLTDGFMRFTKLEPPRRKPLRVEKIVEKLIERIEPTLPKDVEILAEFTPDLPAISVDREQISTALDHLVDNALVAVDKKGRITIKAAFIEKLDANGNTVPAIEIRVSDTGPGIPQEYRSKVFEPYFSLKKGGSGLGLTMARRIVEDHKGTITLDSVEGLGTTFIMTLPLKGGEE
jgi:two-component system nitrogen regulation sensor histidine kinase NtrY